jgi:hypothetical protein
MRQKLVSFRGSTCLGSLGSATTDRNENRTKILKSMCSKSLSDNICQTFFESYLHLESVVETNASKDGVSCLAPLTLRQQFAIKIFVVAEPRQGKPFSILFYETTF